MSPDLTPEAWAQIRYDYEHTERPIADICAEHRLSSGTLRDRMRRWAWTRRRSAIPREGPPAVAPPRRDIVTDPPLPARGERSAAGAERRWPGEGALSNPETGENPPHPICSPSRVEDARERAYGSEIDLSPQTGRGDLAAAPCLAPGEAMNAPAESDPAAIVPLLQGALARVLPAIEATITKLAAEPQRPREMEQTARALGTLMRTLRELNALLREHPLRARNDDDPVPEDIDEFRLELARRIRAFIESRSGEQGDENAVSSSDRPRETCPRESGDPEAENSEQAAAGFPLVRE